MAFLGGTGLNKNGFLGGGVPQQQTFTPVPYEIPLPNQDFSVGASTPRVSTEPGTSKFLAEIAGAPLRSGLQAGLDVQNVFTGNMPSPINPREELGDYAAYFLGDEPIEALSSNVLQAIAGGEQVSGRSNLNTFINTLGVTAGAALNLFPAYGTLARGGVNVLVPKLTKLAVEGASRAGEVNVRRFKPVLVSGGSVDTPINVNTPYVPDSQLPVIDFGRKSSGGLKTIQIEAGTNAPPGYRYIPIEGGQELPVRVSQTQPRQLLAPRTQTTGSVTKAAGDINTALGERGVPQVPESNVARFTSTTKAVELETVDTLLQDWERVKRMIRGEIPSPGGATDQVLFRRATNEALRRNDYETLRDLASSRIATEQSLLGQRLGAAGYVGNALYDPVQAMREIAKVREEVGLKAFKGSPAKIKKVATKEIKTSIEMAAPKNWDEFVDSIVC